MNKTVMTQYGHAVQVRSLCMGSVPVVIDLRNVGLLREGATVAMNISGAREVVALLQEAIAAAEKRAAIAEEE